MRIRQMGFSSRLKAHRHLLTLETLKFIVEYLSDPSEKPNLKGAAIRSGIPELYASRQGQWLKKLPLVQKALETDLDARELRQLQKNIVEIDQKILECRTLLGLEED